MNLAIYERLPAVQPTDRYELFFWYIDKINFVRSCRWRQEMFEPYIREMADLTEELYADWLRAQGMKGDLVGYFLPVLPYISFRFFSAPASKEVDIFKASSAQKSKLVTLLIEDMPHAPEDPLFRACVAEGLKMFLSFLETMRRQREQ